MNKWESLKEKINLMINTNKIVMNNILKRDPIDSERHKRLKRENSLLYMILVTMDSLDEEEAQ